jgi:hypothetical protein
MLAVVVLREVEDQVAAAPAGGPGGHCNQVAADRRGAGPGVATAGAGAGGAQRPAGT